MAALDPVQRLEHDHVHLNRMVESLRESIQACLRGERETAELREDFDDFLQLVRDDLFEHFEREESLLFPFVVEQLPDLAATIDGLEIAHDRMCGVASRMEYVIAQSPAALEENFDQIVTMFARFDANFVKHARDERELIGTLQSRLDKQQRRQVGELLRQL